ncbi:MAG: glycosyltransferase [Elusimicrobiota bacterium]
MDLEKYEAIGQPYVTIALAAYNEEECIGDCLRSLQQQDFKPLEILVVDDGSTDDTAKICEKLGVRVVRGAHKGMGAARNLGIHSARGNILVFADADMQFGPGYVSKLTAPIIRGEVVATCHWNEAVANWDNPWARCQTWFSGLPDRRRHPVAVAENSGQYRAARKDFLLDSGGFSEIQGYSADITISWRTNVYAKIVPDAACSHRNIRNLSELFAESAWHGRGVAVPEGRRLLRCLAAVLLYNNPLFAILRGLHIGIVKREPRMALYSAVYSFGFASGIVRALLSGSYHK